MPLPTLALLLLAVDLLVLVVLGPLGAGVIQWRVSADGLNQTLGADAGMLLLVVPLAVGAAVSWWRGQRLGPPLAFGVGLAALYYALAAVLGADYMRYAGNNERFFPLLLAAIILAWVVSATSWGALEARPPLPPRWLTRAFAGVLLAGGALLTLAWGQQLWQLSTSGALASAADAQAYAEAPSAFWLVRVVDLGGIVPAALATGVGLLLGRPLALRAAFGVGAFLTLQAADVLAMGMIMLAHADPTASVGFVVILAPITLAIGALTVGLFAAYVRSARARTPRRPPGEPRPTHTSIPQPAR